MTTSFECEQCEVILIDADDVFENCCGEKYCQECFCDQWCCCDCEKKLTVQDLEVHHIVLMQFDSEYLCSDNRICWCCLQQDDELLDEIGEICGGRSGKEMKELIVSSLASLENQLG